MYKKLLCSIFCVAFFLIVIAIIIYTYTSSRNPEEKEDAPAIAIYLNDLHKNRRDRIPYEENGPDKQVIIDRVKLGLAYTIDTFKAKSLLFVCNASFPVQWKYLGYGSVYGNVHYRRDVRDFDDKKTYRFSTVIEFTAISEYITGFYECSGFISKQPVNGVYVFAPGSKTFITRTELEMEIDKNTISTWIPCPVSDPKVNVSLRRVILPHETIGVIEEKKFLDEKSFDPKRGFPLKKLLVATEREPWGSYFCHDETHNVYSPIVKVLQPLDEIEATYSEPQIHFVAEKNKTFVTVSCTCKENIYFEILKFNFKSKQLLEKRKKQHKSGEIRIRIPLDKFTNDSVLNCVTTNGYRVLFSWKFLENGSLLKNSSEIMKTARLEYDNATQMFSCCTNSSQRPEMKVLDCSTEGECFLKLTDLNIYSHEGHKFIRNLTASPGSDEGCKTIKVGSLPRGLLQCSMDKYALQTTYYIDTTHGTKLKRGLVSTSPDLIMKVEQISIKRIAGKGIEIGFHCYGPKFFIAQGIQWAKGFLNGSVEYLINQSNSTDVSSKDKLNDWIYITLIDRQVARIYCLAPVIESSNEWLNVSTVVNYNSDNQGSF